MKIFKVTPGVSVAPGVMNTAMLFHQTLRYFAHSVKDIRQNNSICHASIKKARNRTRLYTGFYSLM